MAEYAHGYHYSKNKGGHQMTNIQQTDWAGRIEADIVELKTDVAVLKTDVAELKTDVAVLKVDVSYIKRDISELKTDMKEIRHEVTALRSTMSDYFKKLFTAIIVTTLGLASMIAKSFGWF